MKNAGFWRRFVSNFINNALVGITFGIYIIFIIINYCKAKPSIGMKVMDLEYSTKKNNLNYSYLDYYKDYYTY